MYLVFYRKKAQLLLKYKNQFLDIIKKHKLNPEMFSAQESTLNNESTFVIELTAQPSLKFITKINPKSFHRFNCKRTIFEFGYPERGGYDAQSWVHIGQILEVFEGWLQAEIQGYLNETLQTDLWEQIEQQKALVYASMDRGQFSLFSDEERSQLRMLINEFKLVVEKTFNPSEQERHVIVERLDYLSEAVGRLNRIDWKSVALSTILSISIALSLDTERGKILFALFKQIFSGVVHLLQ